jgi:hypothetical protein
MLRSIGLPEILVILCVGVVFGAVLVILPYWKIFSKAGFPGPMSLLMLIPLVSTIMLFVLAFSDWPALKSSQQSQ